MLLTQNLLLPQGLCPLSYMRSAKFASVSYHQRTTDRESLHINPFVLSPNTTSQFRKAKPDFLGYFYPYCDSTEDLLCCRSDRYPSFR